MKTMKRFFTTLCLSGVLLISLALPTTALDAAFPAYGDGPVEVRIYANYFCPPCKMLESDIEPLLEELLEKQKIRLTMIDVPAGERALLYNHYFLYALKRENNFKRASIVRAMLFDAALVREILTKEELEALFRAEGIDYEVFDATVLYPRFNHYLKEDELRSTPTLIVVGDGTKNTYTGRGSIIKALEELL